MAKSDEIRVRRILERRGLRLERCRRRDPEAAGFGLYRVTTAAGVPLTGDGYTMTLERAEAWCEKSRRGRHVPGPRDGGGATPPKGAFTLLAGDALDELRKLRRPGSQRFACCVTSPPYWQQRCYGGEEGEIGWEETPELYARALVRVFRAVRHVLLDDGLLFLVLGDSYNNRSRIRDGGRQPDDRWADRARHPRGLRLPVTDGGLKEKDLLLLPYVVATALRRDGWWLRQDIIWHKTTCLPEAVQDRPSLVHEHVLMLSKSESYYFDADAVAEPAAFGSADRYRSPFRAPPGRPRTAVRGTRDGGVTRNIRSVWPIPAANAPNGGHPAAMPLELAERCIRAGSRPGNAVLDPFGGVGTTAEAALRLGRRATSIDLSSTFTAVARKRLEALCGG